MKRRIFAGALLCVSLAAGSPPGVMAAVGDDGWTPPPEAFAALNRGLDWLKAQQATNGVWSDPSFPALTALPLWAMCVAGRPGDAEAIARAKAFVASCAQPDGGIYVPAAGRRGGGLGTYNTAICMTALYYTGDPAMHRIIQRARAYVADTQLTGDDLYRGGFGYEKSTGRPYADLNNTCWALAAMRVTQGVEDTRPAGEKRVDVDWEAALAFVERMQLTGRNAATNEAGGFLYNLGNPQAGVATNAAGRPLLRSYGSITYSGLLSLIYAQVARDDPRVVSAVDYARRHWTLDENPGMGQQGLYYYYNIMARALAVAGITELPAATGEGRIRWRDELIAKLIALQRPDGSWANSDNRFWESNPVLATSYSLLALEYALGMFR
jgi:squalene-hopene/tetraprenyl-beta-curcumene cyclase